MTTADEIVDLFERHGNQMYFGENVSILEHSLQTAALAMEANAPAHLVVAALLHDVGHLLHGMPEDIAQRNIDARHELAGEEWLRGRFGPEVTEPVRLHVDAKRYLCAVNAGYLQQLSPSSLHSLELQGGSFSAEEALAFESNPYFRDAVRMREWDDAAKELGASSPELRTYRAAIESSLLTVADRE